MTLLQLEAETNLSTSGPGSRALPCAVAACDATRTTAAALVIGGRERQVPLCGEHARHWGGADHLRG